MPYIEPNQRDGVDDGCSPSTPGELNYLITSIIDEYLGEEPGYTQYNEVVGALECAKLEFYRRMIVPYEAFKLALNGDVYTERPIPRDPSSS